MLTSYGIDIELVYYCCLSCSIIEHASFLDRLCTLPLNVKDRALSVPIKNVVLATCSFKYEV